MIALARPPSWGESLIGPGSAVWPARCPVPPCRWPVRAADPHTAHADSQSRWRHGPRRRASSLCRYSCGSDGLPDRLCFKWVTLVHHQSLWKFTVGLPGSSGGAAGADGFVDVTLFNNNAHTSIRVPSTVKRSSDNRPSRRAAATTVSKNRRPRHEPTAARCSD